MKITRLYTGPDGMSVFEDMDIELKDKGNIGFLSEPYKAKSIIFRETDGSYNYNWHNAPQRQLVIMVDGEVEIEVGDGTKRRFSTGDIILTEDVTGQGHISRAVDKKPRKSIFVILD
jgi:hypothetical protein